MRRLIAMNLSTMAIMGLVVLFLSAVSIQAASANGKDHHHADKGMSQHMKEMYALKDKIPEEYRIMERTPVIPSEKSLQQGKDLFEQSCVVCHGEAGDGKGPAAGAMPTPPANFLDKKHSAIYGPGEKYWIIGNGSGKTGMPEFPKIDAINRWHLVNYILHLQQEGAAQTKRHGHH
ncbi:MAG: c-type cytochrome [Desulfuromonadales bacterium]|nr:c-type cytochrome [Desulfuromonadales bacterium]